MSVNYFTRDGNQYSPVWKTRTVDNLSSVGVETWTGTAQIVLTDLVVSITNAGTFAIKYGRAASSSIIFMTSAAGSVNLRYGFETPFVGDRGGANPGNVYFEGGPGVGAGYINLAGFEIY